MIATGAELHPDLAFATAFLDRLVEMYSCVLLDRPLPAMTSILRAHPGYCAECGIACAIYADLEAHRAQGMHLTCYRY